MIKALTIKSIALTIVIIFLANRLRISKIQKENPWKNGKKTKMKVVLQVRKNLNPDLDLVPKTKIQ